MAVTGLRANGQTSSVPRAAGASHAVTQEQKPGTAKPVQADAPTAQKSAVKSAESAAAPPLTIELYATKVRFENDGSGTRQFDARVKVGTLEGASDLKTLSFDYNSAHEKFALVFLRVTKADGKTVEAKPDAVTDGLAPAAKDAPAFSELREARVTVPPLAAGDTLSYEVRTDIVKPVAAGEFWFSHSFLTSRPALDEELEINVPAERNIHLHNAPQFAPKISTDGGRKIYSWKRLNAVPVGTGAEQSSASAKSPDVAFTTFASWEAFAKWFATAEHPASDAVAAKAKELVASQKTDADKIEALYDFAAKQIHLLRIPAEQTDFQLHDAAQVMTAGYGDELDKCALLAAILNASGYHADVALLPAGEKFDRDFPFPGAVSHAVVVATAGKDTFWMDPSADTLPFQMLLPNARGKSALVAPAGAAPHFVDTPVDPPFQSTQSVDIDARVNSLGRLTAKVRYVVRGDNEYALRMAFETTPQSQWNAVTQTMATVDGLHGAVFNAKPSDPAATRDPFTLDFVLVLPDFLDWSQKRALVALPLPALGLPDEPSDASKGVTLGSPLDVTVKLTLDLPVNDSPRVPPGAAVKRDYAEYRSEYSAGEHSVTVQKTLRFVSRELPAASRADYEAFAAAVQSDEAQGVVVDNIIPGVPSDASPSQLMEAATTSMQTKHLTNALLLYQQVEQLNPRQANLWLGMGTALLQLGKYDDAITAFRKQLEANPKDESANNLMGVAFYDEKKYDEAIAAFKKQIELKPLDENAHMYLGSVYNDQKKFIEAHAELEKAEVLTPNSATVQLRLGETELGLGKTDAALADFEKASTLSPSPVMANEIAFTLAEHKAALNRAKEYADAAVGPTENSLSRISLRRVTTNDLAEIDALPAFWDTLGWVYFRQGKTVEAQSLIEAAWRLNQTGDTGDHLGQIYEARGQKESAIAAYAEAVAAGAGTETRERLKKLMGAQTTSAAIDARVKRASSELIQARTVALGKTTVTGKAEFVVLVGAGPSGATGRDAKFLAGSDKLAFVTSRLHDAQFHPILPRATPAKIVLRGVVACSAKTAKCEFLFDRPRDLVAPR